MHIDICSELAQELTPEKLAEAVRQFRDALGLTRSFDVTVTPRKEAHEFQEHLAS